MCISHKYELISPPEAVCSVRYCFPFAFLHFTCYIWMYRHASYLRSASNPICFTLTIRQTQTEHGFPWLVQIKGSNHLKTHKKSHFPCGALRGDGPVQAQLLFTVCVCVGVCIDLAHVHGIQLSWEICSKLNFKQTWVYLMRCWSGVQVCSQKTGWQNSMTNIDTQN